MMLRLLGLGKEDGRDISLRGIASAERQKRAENGTSFGYSISLLDYSHIPYVYRS